MTFSAPRVWPKSRRVAPPPTLCASREWEGPFRRVPRLWDLLKALSLVEGLPCRDRLQRKLIALGDWDHLNLVVGASHLAPYGPLRTTEPNSPVALCTWSTSRNEPQPDGLPGWPYPSQTLTTKAAAKPSGAISVTEEIAHEARRSLKWDFRKSQGKGSEYGGAALPHHQRASRQGTHPRTARSPGPDRRHVGSTWRRHGCPGCIPPSGELPIRRSRSATHGLA